jgi:bacteriorhodopsin
MALYFVAAVSIAVFVVRIMRRRSQPQRSFSPELVLAFIPFFCASAYLVLGIFRILEVSSRVQVSHSILEDKMHYALRPLGMALVSSTLMLLLILLVRTIIKRKARQNDAG